MAAAMPLVSCVLADVYSRAGAGAGGEDGSLGLGWMLLADGLALAPSGGTRTDVMWGPQLSLTH